MYIGGQGRRNSLSKMGSLAIVERPVLNHKKRNLLPHVAAPATPNMRDTPGDFCAP
jgi:hypothetical protein